MCFGLRVVVIAREFSRLDISFFKYALVLVVLVVGVLGHMYNGATSYRRKFRSYRRRNIYEHCC